jgi:hypothetical protein
MGMRVGDESKDIGKTLRKDVLSAANWNLANSQLRHYDRAISSVHWCILCAVDQCIYDMRGLRALLILGVRAMREPQLAG